LRGGSVMRTLFVLYLVMIVAGIGFAILVGALAQ
jgi:hypothetical protein